MDETLPSPEHWHRVVPERMFVSYKETSFVSVEV